MVRHRQVPKRRAYWLPHESPADDFPAPLICRQDSVRSPAFELSGARGTAGRIADGEQPYVCLPPIADVRGLPAYLGRRDPICLALKFSPQRPGVPRPAENLPDGRASLCRRRDNHSLQPASSLAAAKSP